MFPKRIFTALSPSKGIRKSLVVGMLSATLMSSTALAHTNSIGYVGDGNGGLNFWYGSWHDGTTFNEAEIKITHPDGTTSVDAFDLLSQDSPAGLISGVNFFTSDGTQLVPYDPTGSSNGGVTQESYTWQGLNYTLTPGTYTFTYIPLGDPDSNLPGSATAEWMPMDQVIRSLTITLTQNDIDGDANNNGILDINEVAVGSASGGPTVVSQGSSQVIGYIAVAGGVIQVIQRTQTDTTWDNMSDGTIANQQSTVTNLSDWIGRVDQITTAQDAVNALVRSLEFDGPSAIRANHKYDNGMKGDTKGFSFGGKHQNEEGVVIGGGLANMDTDLKNDSDSVKSKTTTFMGSIGKEFDFAYAEAKVQRSTSTFDVSRTIGDFSNSGNTKGSDMNLSIMLNKDINEKLSVIGGVTKGRQTVVGYTETGSVQSARTIAKYTKNYTYGTVGGNLDLGLVNLSAVRHTDNVNELSAGISKDNNNVIWEIKVKRSMTSLGNSNSLDAGLNIKF
jgi:hypothetical protein